MARRTSPSIKVNPRQQARDQVAYERELGSRATGEELRSGAQDAYRADRLKAIASGVPESSLPPVTPGMDLKAANQRLSFATGGRGSANPGAVPNSALSQAAGVNTGLVPGRTQADNVAGALAASAAPFVPTKDKLNVPNQKITSGGAPAVDAALQRNLALTQPGGGRGLLQPTTSALTAAAAPVSPASTGIGKVVTDGRYDAALDAVQTPGEKANPYGTGSVRMAGKNEVTQPAKVTDTGVTRGLTPDEMQTKNEGLKAKYPELFVAGSPHNQAFLAHAKEYGVDDAYNNADSVLGTVTASNRAVAAQNQAPSVQDSTLGTDAQIADVNKTLHTPTPETPGLLTRAGNAIAGLFSGSASPSTAPTRGGAQPLKQMTRAGVPVTSPGTGSGGSLASSLSNAAGAAIGAGTATYTPPVRVAPNLAAPSTGGSVGSALTQAATLFPGANGPVPDPIVDAKKKKNPLDAL